MKKHTFYAEIDPYELGCRMLESELQRPRPQGATAREAIEMLGPEDAQKLMRSAMGAFKYFEEVIAQMKREQ